MQQKSNQEHADDFQNFINNSAAPELKNQGAIWRGTIGPNDLVYVPAGYVWNEVVQHQEASTGIKVGVVHRCNFPYLRMIDRESELFGKVSPALKSCLKVRLV